MLTVENAAAEGARFIDEIPPYPGDFAGRGIVTCAGGVKYLTCAWVLIKMLRHLGCKLPIEVWYLGQDEGDPDWIELVKPFGVTCIDSFAVREKHPHPRLGGWQCKAYALRHTKIREVLFLDADNVPVVDPSFLFDEPQYRETGAVFWPDGSRTPSSSPAWEVFGVPFRDEREFESGQYLVDKERCWPAVCLADWYNQHSNFFYQYIYGDKDSFRFAWHRLGLPFAMPEADVTTVPFTLCQHGFDGERLFQHRTGAKWSLAANGFDSSFYFAEVVADSLANLRELWNPVKWLARHSSQDDLAMRERLAGRTFGFARVGQSAEIVKLEAGGSIIPTKRHRCFWWCSQGELHVADDRGQSQHPLRLQSDGTFRESNVGLPGGRLVRMTPRRRPNRVLSRAGP